MANINNKVLVIIGCVLALIGWVVALAGVARVNDLCNGGLNSIADGKGMHKECSDPLSYHWWGVWFSFFLTVVIIVMAIFGKVDAWASTLQAFSAACLSVTMIDANAVYGSKYLASSSDYGSAVDAALAGFVIVSIALMLLIVFMGMAGAGVKVCVSVAANKTAPEQPAPAPAKTAETA